MESESRISQWMTTVSDWLAEQVWFQQLKAKWEELDPQSRVYLKAGGVAGSLLILVIMLLSAVWNVHSLKSELSDKTDLLTSLQSANEELRRLKDETAGAANAGTGNAGGTWNSYFEGVGNTAGVDKAGLTVSADKAGTASEQAKETLFDLSLKHVSIKQVVRYAFNLENGARPVKLRNMMIDTHADPAGYMDATLSVSAFALITK